MNRSPFRLGRSCLVFKNFRRNSLVSFVLATTFFLISASTFGAKAGDPPTTIDVSRGVLKIVFQLFGVVGANAEVAIQARVPGEVVSLPVKEGQAVKKEQVLLEVAPREYELELACAQVRVIEAAAHQRMAQLRLEMEKQRYAVVSQSHTLTNAFAEKMESIPTTYTLELLRQEVVSAEAATSNSRVAVEEAKTRLANTRLVSPIDGTVTEILSAPGQIISPTDCKSGKTILKVVDLSKIVVDAEIDQMKIRDIQLNLAASVALPAFPDRTFPGRIVSISPRGYFRNNSVFFPIRIELEGDPGDAARLGLTANCEIVAIEKPNVLLLENRAILRDQDQKTSVLVLEQDKTRSQPIKIGRTNGVVTEVLEGLREGEKVVLP